jgi:hypothetical protein
MEENKNASKVDDDQGRDGTSAVDIPILKEKKDDKQGGAVLTQGQGAASIGKRSLWSRFFGAAARGGSGGIEIAVKSGMGAAKAGGLKALLAGKIGIAAIGLGVGGSGLIGFGVIQQGRAKQQLNEAAPELGGITSSISAHKRNAQGSKSLSFAQRMSKGILRWEAGAKKDAPSPQKEKTAAADAPAADANAQAEDMMDKMMGQVPAEGGADRRLNGDIGKLSSQIGGSSAFGGKSIFKGGGSNFNMKDMSKLGSVQNLSRTKQAARGGSLNTKRSTNARLAKSMSTRRSVGAGKTVRQLKFANQMSQGASSRSGSSASTMAADAFDQQTTQGESAGNIGEGSADGSPSGGAGAGGGGGIAPMPPRSKKCNQGEELTSDGFCLPRIDNGTNVGGQFLDSVIKNYRKQMDDAEKQIKTGWWLVGIGIALIVAGGIWDMGVLKVIGAILIVIGGVMIAMGESQKKDAKRQLEKTLKEQEKQEDLYQSIVEEDEAKRREIHERLKEDRVDPNDPEASGQPNTYFWHEGELWKWDANGKGQEIKEDVTFADGSQYKSNGDGGFDYWKTNQDGQLQIDEDPDNWKASQEITPDE